MGVPIVNDWTDEWLDRHNSGLVDYHLATPLLFPTTSYMSSANCSPDLQATSSGQTYGRVTRSMLAVRATLRPTVFQA